MAVAGAQFSITPMQAAAVATGNGTAMNVIENGQAMYTWVAQVKGITSATITWEATVNGTDWTGILMGPITTGTGALTATADGIYRGTVIGLVAVRARISTWVSGAITVTGVLTAY